MTDSLATLIQAVDAADSSSLLLDAVENLAAAVQEGAIPTLIATLSYNNPGAAVAAVEGLIQLGTPAVPSLLEQLDQHNYTARAWAIRALAGIGDPRGLAILLAAATDFALSVRRAAVRGLGTIQWAWFPEELFDIALPQALQSLLHVAQQDEEWVVRYSAVVGLQELFHAIPTAHLEWRSQLQSQFEEMSTHESSVAVRARVWMAQRNLQTKGAVRSSPVEKTPSPLSAKDWQILREQLHERSQQDRFRCSEPQLQS